MKKLLQVACMILLCAFFSNASNQQAYSLQHKNTLKQGVYIEDGGEILVIFEKLSEKETDALARCFSGIEGISITGSCPRLKCYYFSYDKRLYSTPGNVFEVVSRASGKYGPIHKTGTSGQVDKICNKF